MWNGTIDLARHSYVTTNAMIVGCMIWMVLTVCSWIKSSPADDESSRSQKLAVIQRSLVRQIDYEQAVSILKEGGNSADTIRQLEGFADWYVDNVTESEQLWLYDTNAERNQTTGEWGYATVKGDCVQEWFEIASYLC